MTASPLLVLSASTGSGHTRAAEALRQGCVERYPDVEVRHVDVLDLAPAWVRRLYGAGYEAMAARTPWLWHRIYRYTDGEGADLARWAPLAERLIFREFRRLLASRPWGVCLCTHFLPCQVAAGRPGLPPFALALTDFTLHRYWVQPGVRHYFTASEPLAAALRRRAPGARVEATGIPVAPGFSRAAPRAAARGALGIAPDRTVLLVMGGGLGLGVEAMTEPLLALPCETLQVVTVCGRNGPARARLLARAAHDPRLRVEGYVADVERWIAAADVVVSKPGGLTCSEALALGTPLLLTRPVPGQEQGNAGFLAGAGAALRADDPAALRDAAAALLADPARLAALRHAAARLGRPHAANAVLQGVLSSHASPRAA